MGTNLKGIFLCTKYAIPHIRNSKNGKIIISPQKLDFMGFHSFQYTLPQNLG